MILPILHRFHAVKTDHQHSPHLFARLSPPHLQIIHAHSAYTSEIGTQPHIQNAQVKGTCTPISTTLLSIVLSAPATVASIDKHRATLQLTCVDTASLQLHITLPIVVTASEPLLNQLHQSLITAVASLEAYLLAASGEDPHLQEGHHIHSLQALHAPPMHAGEPIAKHAAFRRMSANDMHILSARAMAAAQAASDTRRVILNSRQQRKERELKKRQMERDRIKKAKARNADRKKQRSLFKEYKPVEEQRNETRNNTPTQPKTTPTVTQQASAPEKHQSQDLENGEQAAVSKQRIGKGASSALEHKSVNNPSDVEKHNAPRGEQQQHLNDAGAPASSAAENTSTVPSADAPKRKKRRKALRLV